MSRESIRKRLAVTRKMTVVEVMADPTPVAHLLDDAPALLAVADAAASVLWNHDAQRYLHSTNYSLFVQRGGFPRAEELREDEREAMQALRDSLAALESQP